MYQLGKYNSLKVIKQLPFGIYLDGGNEEEILMPTRYVPKDTEIGSMLDVFIYRDSEDRLLATTEKPFGIVGDMVMLEVIQTNSLGIFVNWGLPKDLYIPFQEQAGRMAEGRKYPIYIYIDEETDRIVGSARIEHFLKDYSPNVNYEIGQKVQIKPFKYTELGIKCTVNETYEGLLYNNELFTKLELTHTYDAYIKNIRNDGKLDLKFKPIGFVKQVEPNQALIIKLLKENNGSLPHHDKTDAQIIYSFYGISKREFKQAIGSLYKSDTIKITPIGISLLNN